MQLSPPGPAFVLEGPVRNLLARICDFVPCDRIVQRAYCIPANSHALGVSLTPSGWKLQSHTGSRLRANFSCLIQKCELLPSWLTQLLKICSSNPCKERKPCVKWINDNSFLVISDFWSEKHLKRARVYTRPKTSDVFGRLRTSSEDFRLLRESSEMIVSSSKMPRTPRRKVSRLHLAKSWQVYYCIRFL